ncbi:MAG: cell wall hydrolase [Clostridia bacterium]|nr:cell wall hydrolase [Clostridia bacterium]
MAYSDRELLARLIQCEAGGEGDNGMRAVATVVMNRVRASGGEYARISQGGNLRNIVFQSGQFDCVMETIGGRYNSQNIYNMRPEAIHYEIADWAIAGNRLYNVGEALWFYNPYNSGCRTYFPSSVGVFAVKIVQHCFYIPTSAYYLT